MARWFKLTGYAPGFVAGLRQVQPQIIHAHFEEAGLAGLFLARSLGVPLVTTFHGYDATAADPHAGAKRLIGRIYQAQRRELQRSGATFIAVSNFIRDKIVARGYPDERVTVLPIGVDTDVFKPGREEGPPMVLFVGRLVEKKGCTYLLKAMRRVSAKHPEARLVIIGDGPLRASLEQEACELRLPNVLFAGTLDSTAVRNYMAQAALLVAPSVTAASGDSEGLPIVACEAQAMGLPVVGTRHAGIPEVVKDRQTGFIVAERSPEELAEAMLTLLRSRGLRAYFGAVARMNICQNFCLETQTRRLEEVYREAIERTQGLRLKEAA